MNSKDYNIHGIYFSPTATTKQVVEAIATSINSQCSIIDITLPESRKSIPSYSSKDLLVIGFPVYSGRIPLTVESYIKMLTGDNTPVIIVGVYGNRDYDDMLLEMKDILTEGGFIPLSAGAFIGEHSYASEVATARPDDKDIIIAQSFANQSINLLDIADLLQLKLNVKGNYPYKERKDRPPLGPTVNDACTKCGTCVAACPTGALSMSQQLQVDESLCIQCCSCVKKCPNHGIAFTERIPDFRVFLMENCSERKEPELFYAV